MKKITLFSICLFGLITMAHAQNIITVDNSPGSAAQFSDLQSAISQAQNGDIIYVHPSETNYGNINIDKPLTLIGFSHSSPDKETLITDLVFGPLASNVTIRGIHLTDDLIISNTGVTLENIVLENNRLDDSLTFGGGGVNNITVRGNIIDTFGFGSTANSTFTNALITNNIVFGGVNVLFHESTTIKNNIFLTADVFNGRDETGNIEVQNCIFIGNTSGTANFNDDGILFQNCLAFNIGSGNATPLVGTDNLENIDPLFVEDNDNIIFEATIDDYNLQQGSIARGAGISGEDLGLFDGSGFVFDNFGFTNGIPTVNIQAISTSVAPGQSLNVIINTSNQ